MVENLNEESFKKKIFDYDVEGDYKLLIKEDTVIEFWVTWCPHCQAMIPRYEEVSEKFKEVKCYRIEMEQHPDLAQLFEVEGFPTFIFITKDGKMSRWEGEVPEEELASLFTKAFKIHK